MSDEVLHVKITGVRPLLMNRPQIEVTKNSKKVTSYDPVEEAAKALYRNKEGIISIPGLAVLACLRKAAAEHKAPGKGRKTLKEFVYSGLQINQEWIPVTPQEYEVDARPVVIQRNRVMKWRPKFDQWSCEFDITIIDPSTWSPVYVRNILEDAGKFCGLLDYRPLFGTFAVNGVYNVTANKEVK